MILSSLAILRFLCFLAGAVGKSVLGLPMEYIVSGGEYFVKSESDFAPSQMPFNTIFS